LCYFLIMVKKSFVHLNTSDFEIDWRTPRGRAELEFWREVIKPFRSQSLPNIYGKSRMPISGVFLYMHKNGIFVYSEQYPDGVIRDVNAYRATMAKMKALDSLEWAEREEAERIAQSIPEIANL